MSKSRPINKAPTKVAREAAAEQARKEASKAALHAVIDPPKPVAPVVDPVVVQKQRSERAIQDAKNALSMAKADAEATGVTLEAMLAEMGIDAEGFPLVEEKQRYDGPMLALVSARKHYIKAPNGILCNGDGLATALGALTREQVCAVLIKAMGLGSNPYLHLNPGQQSMNLRNKARQQLIKGQLSMAVIAAAINQVTPKAGS